LASTKSDKLCDELSKFANAAGEKSSISVNYVANWSEFSKSCKHNNQLAAKEFCSFLLPNMSTEFMQINVSRVMECLSERKNNIFNSDLSFNMATGEFTVYEMNGVSSDVSITISYSFGVNEKTELNITASKE
jgi:hypothetical protein